ncbi:MAG: excinuclease ABC subunit UvrC [Eubacteriales bacterium]|jgi:excinuclease ABC subunit C
MENQTFIRVKEKVKSLPLEPGVYIMLDASGKVIYVGKAKQLKNRVSQYFQDSQGHSQKTRNMVSQIHDFDYIVAASEFEALVLECSLIKRHMPKYNILLKDGKGYPFIRINLKEPYPRFTMEPKLKSDGAKYFGPYGGRHTTAKIIEALQDAFLLPDCERSFPRDIGKERPCLRYHMKKCIAPCKESTDHEGFLELVTQAVSLLEGKYENVLKEIRSEMEQAAEELLFEKAAALRDRYNAISRLGQRQNVVSSFKADTDVVGYYDGPRKAIAILHYIDGMLLEKDVTLVDNFVEDNASDMIDAYITQFYSGRSALPRFILLPVDIENRESLEKLLSDAAGRKVEIAVPQRGKKLDMVRLAEKNAQEEAERLATRKDRRERNLRILQKALGLEEMPRRIEAYDISNLAGSDIVASMTVFEDGAPLKKGYRRFKIKATQGQDDYGSMREVLTRRFRRLLEGDEKFGKKPDLLLVDGGAQHAKIAAGVISEAGLSIPVYGMVKDGRHRTRALVLPNGSEVGITEVPQLFSMIGKIQEETHRFAIEYNRSMRKRRVSGSELDKIEGVGPVRKKALLKKFRSIKAIKSASVEELAEVVPISTAESIRRYFAPKQDEVNNEGTFKEDAQ